MTHDSPKSTSLLSHALRASLAGIGLFALTSTGCLDRPVAEVEPSTTNIIVEPLIQNAVDKIDLLFMIDNSRSMADKQRILRDAVPLLLRRLITPRCIDPTTKEVVSDFPCANGTEPEFNAIDDIHIGVITSSLGGHGADQCSPAIGDQFDPSQDDKAQLLPSVPRKDAAGNPVTLPQFQTTGFLAWDPDQKYGGQTDREALITDFQSQVTAAGEIGCGFEASLEAWYRFLIDPEPPLDVVVNNNVAEVVRPNRTVLDQRAKFLRPDSLLAIIMLTDENDCSTIDGGYGWLAGQQGAGDGYHLPRATEVCSRNPNDPCCRSCQSLEDRPPTNCQALAADPGCAPRDHTPETDHINLRCWDQKRRFGIEFLYGVERYIKGLMSPTVPDSKGNAVSNPLYMDLSGANKPARTQNLVFLAGIVGVPWQDIATEDTLHNDNDLKYLSAEDIGKLGRWDMILGDPSAGVLPTDALMIESLRDRTTIPGVNPAHPLGFGSLVSVPPAGQLRGNPINGNEYTPADSADLQYACIFPIEGDRPCAGKVGCDCSERDQGIGKPLCNATEQDFAKAYPGTRHLQVLKGIGEQIPDLNNAIVASICPKVTDRNNAAYGYNPAVAAIIDQLKEQFGGKCLPRPLAVDKTTGKVPCAVVEALRSQTGTCNSCNAGRARADLVGDDQALSAPVRERLAVMGQCGGDTGIRCEDFCLCKILPAAAGAAEESCLNDPNAANTGNQFGYCYVDPERGRGSPAVVEQCPDTGKRKIQFIGENTPANGSIALIACLGANIHDEEDAAR